MIANIQIKMNNNNYWYSFFIFSRAYQEELRETGEILALKEIQALILNRLLFGCFNIVTKLNIQLLRQITMFVKSIHSFTSLFNKGNNRLTIFQKE